MGTGYYGTFVISCSQTEVDGQKPAEQERFVQGASWRWTGECIRVDGPGDLLSLGAAVGATDLRKKAARTVRRLLGDALERTHRVGSGETPEPDDGFVDSGFTVSDGRKTFRIELIDTGAGGVPLLVVIGELPPKNQDLWIVERTHSDHVIRYEGNLVDSVICFTPGTRLLTPDGQMRVEDLCEGDRVATKDGGDQEIRWIGQSRMSGARLYALPHLRPVRLRAGALAQGEPDDDLLVSPDHRVVVKGAQAQALFGQPEVLVSAKDLINDVTVTRDFAQREVRYIHLMLDAHQIVWANGVETESFHPGMASLDTIAADQQARLFDVMPELQSDPFTYGDPVRRNLTMSEAAILQFDGGLLR